MMPQDFDILIAGAGLCGCVIAREMAEAGKKVLILERREQAGGNLFDRVDEETGIRVQIYGPHAFHTDKEELFAYITQFGEWIPYRLTCRVEMLGKTTPSPFNFQTADDYFSPAEAQNIKAHLQSAFPGRGQAAVLELLSSPDAAVRGFGEFLFRHDYSLYTAKQWGIPPERVDPGVLARVPVVFSYRDGYFDDPYQAMPAGGFSAVLKEMTAHPNIRIRLKTDALSVFEADPEHGLLRISGVPTDKTVFYTGALDELLGYRFGRLPYRSLRFEWERHTADGAQPAPIVAYPEAKGYTRITEYGKFPPQAARGGTITAKEFPLPSGEGREPYYPVHTKESAALYEKYRRAAEGIDSLRLCGRLADFQYYDMDQAIERALRLSRELKRSGDL
ncbi:UDP-galactopyranose mutase [Papillibacter cinnamivorans]|uniref:UDP-galactopyranose mutase n=1 Tax=Papillibacter cinnamivorans DSM 12816 TaxID=1122930 RepID=A0A1W2CDE8_9FIRM|nr:UDP-galactopyranose mutase [Papillibacter cinnamivorans]SMC83004.1 UDP-galactopyranose mutase [Papillibacter cinnamivorans DSM 12816]